ncbi:hypothetical protein [Azospirillum sp. sgz302134]
MEETKLTAALPNLDIQILHREDPERGAEVIALQITATPSFDALRGMLNPMLLNPMLGQSMNPFAAVWAAPMQAWAGMVRQAWAPWLRMLPSPTSHSEK